MRGDVLDETITLRPRALATLTTPQKKTKQLPGCRGCILWPRLWVQGLGSHGVKCAATLSQNMAATSTSATDGSCATARRLSLRTSSLEFCSRSGRKQNVFRVYGASPSYFVKMLLPSKPPA